MIDILDHAFAKLGLDRAELLPLRRIDALFSATLPDGTVVTLSGGPNLTVAGRTVNATRLQQELQRMIDRWRPVLRVGRCGLGRQDWSAPIAARG